MEDKRFKKCKSKVYDNWREKSYTLDECIDEMNILSEVCELLKGENTTLHYELLGLQKKTKDENEQLRQEVAHWKHQAEKLAKFERWKNK